MEGRKSYTNKSCVGVCKGANNCGIVGLGCGNK